MTNSPKICLFSLIPGEWLHGQRVVIEVDAHFDIWISPNGQVENGSPIAGVAIAHRPRCVFEEPQIFRETFLLGTVPSLALRTVTHAFAGRVGLPESQHVAAVPGLLHNPML